MVLPMADGLPPPPRIDAIKTLPHNLDAEQAVLGALLVDNELYARIAGTLEASHFYDPAHGKIFGFIEARVSKGHLADGVTLRDAFAKDGALQEIGGAAYIAELVDAQGAPAAIMDYARLIADLSVRRELIRIGGDLASEAEAADGLEAGLDLLGQAERKLYALAERGQASQGFVPFHEAMRRSLETAEAALKRDGGLSGVPSGFRDLDRLLGGLHRSDLIILAGRPSMGKTALAANIAYKAARRFRREAQPNGDQKTVDGGVVGFYSLEMSAEQLATRLLADFAEIPSDRIRRGDINESDYGALRDAVQDLERLPLYIDETGGISISALAARARRLQRTQGLDLLIVDYLQLVTASGNRKDGNRVQEVSEITQGLKALAKELNICVVALSQLSRQVENRDDKRPQLSDLRESGSIEQDADVVMFVYREAYYLGRAEPGRRPGESDDDFAKRHFEWTEQLSKMENRAEVIVAKQRHGPIANVQLGFRGELTRFTDLDLSGRYDEPHG
jgi:replicative DNA helicase